MMLCKGGFEEERFLKTLVDIECWGLEQPVGVGATIGTKFE